MIRCILTLPLLFYIARIYALVIANSSDQTLTISNPSDQWACVDTSVTIPWIYQNVTDMHLVVWKFINEYESQTILEHRSGRKAVKLSKHLAIRHNGNGNITLIGVRQQYSGKYQIKVTYRTTQETAEDEVLVKVLSPLRPTAVRSQEGNRTNYTCPRGHQQHIVNSIFNKEIYNETNSDGHTIQVQCCIDDDVVPVRSLNKFEESECCFVDEELVSVHTGDLAALLVTIVYFIFVSIPVCLLFGCLSFCRRRCTGKQKRFEQFNERYYNHQRLSTDIH